jgi:hypothetical protein
MKLLGTRSRVKALQRRLSVHGQPATDEHQECIARAEVEANTRLLDLFRQMRAQPLEVRIKPYGPREKAMQDYSDAALDLKITDCEARIAQGQGFGKAP